jgi:hypothetical protein
VFIRIVGGFLVLLALLWAVAYFSAGAALRDAQREPWPYGLGTLEALKERQPPRAASKEATEVERLVDALNLEDVNVDDYVDAQTAKRDDTIDAPPAGLDAREAPLVEIVRTTVSAGDRLVWGPDGAPYELDDAAELLAADALAHARNGDGAGGWERVHAIWLLTRSTKWDASVYGAKSVLRMERAANAVARKLPAPAPAWAAELAAVEPRRDTAAGIQQQTLSRIQTMPPLPGPFIIFRPISNFIEASNARRSRADAESLAAAQRCHMQTDLVADPADAYRASRMEAELEATAKMLVLKSEHARLGKWPAGLDPSSRCAESRWIYEAKPDGSSMTLRLSWDLAPEPGVKNAPALQFAY